MSKRSNDPFSARTPRKGTREPIDMPREFHEDGAPEYAPLPDEFNRFAPVTEETGSDASGARRLMKVMLYVAAAGLIVLGVLLPKRAEPSPVPDPTHAVAPGTAVVTSVPDTTAPARNTPEATAPPSPVPTEKPTPEPDVEGVQMLEAEWTDGSGEGATLRLVARIPKHNADAGITIGDFYAWLDGEGALEDWDGIMTPSELDTAFTEDEYGNTIVTFTGTLYWPNRAPSAADAITVAATGWDPDTQAETEASNALTVRFGQRVTIENEQ